MISYWHATTALKENEILLGDTLPHRSWARWQCLSEKLANRVSLIYAVAGCAAVAPDGDGTCTAASLALHGCR